MGYTPEQINAVDPKDRWLIVANHRLLRVMGYSRSMAVAQIGGLINLGQSIERLYESLQGVVGQYRAMVPKQSDSGSSQDAAAAPRSEDSVNRLLDLGYSIERINTIRPEIRPMVAQFHEALSSQGVSQEKILSIAPHLQTLDLLVDKVEWIVNSLKGESPTSA